MLKKKVFGLLSIVLMLATIGLVGCTRGGDNVTIDVNTETITIVMGEQPEQETWDVNTAKFRVQTNVSTQVLYRIENEGVIKVTNDAEKSTDTTKVAIVTALKTGTAKIIIFTPESSKVSKEIIVNVVQPITSISFVEDYALYIPMGEKRAIDIDNAFDIEPLYGNKQDLRFKIINDQYGLGATIGETTGIIDATNVTKVGDLTVRVYTSEEIYADTVVHIVKPITASDVSVTTESGDIILSNGNFGENGNSMVLIKTTENYSFTTLNISVNTSSDYEITPTLSNSKVIEYQKISTNSFVVKALELGQSDLKFSINILGANGVAPYEFTLDFHVYDKPLDININGQSANGMGNIYNATIYNHYNQGELGTPFRFTLNPSTVSEENSDLVITFNNPITAVNSIAVFNVYGDRLGLQYDANGNVVSFAPFTIKAGDTIYIKSTLNEVNSEEFSFVVSSAFSQVYKPEVSATVNLTLKEGISEFSYDRPNLYIEQGQTKVVYLQVGRENADTLGIYYEVQGDAVEVIKITGQDANNKNYIISAQKLGDAVVTFYSGNGFEVVVNVKVYNPLTEMVLTSESPNQNGAIGEREFTDESLTYIAVATGSKFNLQYVTNLGASIASAKYEIINGNVYVSTTSEGLISILGVGTATVKVSLYGYDDNGVASDALYRTVVLEGYVPVSSIVLNNTTLNLKDFESVGYYKVAEYSQKQLVVNVYPSNAVIEDDDISWSVVGDGGKISATNGHSTVFTAGPLGDYDSASLKVLVKLVDHGRVFSQVCNIEITKAIKVKDIRLVNVFNSEIYFDGRDGLGVDAKTFGVVANTYPTNAFNKALRFNYIHTDTENNSPVFSVDSMGNVRPIRGGEAILRIGAEDSFDETGDASVYIDVRVVVSDGKSKETAYRIYDANDLMAIGDNKTSLSSFYVLASDIDLTSVKVWTPIGLKKGKAIPFSGYLGGKYTVGIGSNQSEISSKIYGLSITNGFDAEYVLNEGTDKETRGKGYFAGLFGVVSESAVFESLQVDITELAINTSRATNPDVYIGGLVGLQTVEGSNFPESEFVFNDINVSINEYNVICTSNTNVYIGGLLAKSSMEGILVDLINDSYVNIVSMSVDGSANSLYVGGLAGYIDAKADIIGTYTMDNSEGTNFGAVFGDEGFGCVANIEVIANANISAIGGLVGFADSLHKLSNIGFKGNISAVNSNNVGGLIGQVVSYESEFDNRLDNFATLNTVTFFGKVVGFDNVGGLVGSSDVNIFNAIVENYGDTIVEGNQNVGGAVGYLDNARISLAMVTSSNQGPSVVGDTNIGTMVGYMNGGLLEAVYTDISTSIQNVALIGESSNSTVKNSFVQKGVINATNNESCYIFEENNAEQAWNSLTNKEFNLSEISGAILGPNDETIYNYYQVKWYKPGQDNINVSVNNGFPIFGLKGSLPFFNVIPSDINVNVEDSKNIFKIDDKNILSFYYELSQNLIDTTSAQDITSLYKSALKLNTLDLNDLNCIQVNVIPQSFRLVRLNVEAFDINGGISDVIKVTSDGKIILTKEGLATLKISSLINPNANDNIYVNTRNKITNFTLNCSDLGNSSEELKNIEIRKGESGYYFVYLENYDKFNNIQYNYTDKFEVVYTIYATEADNIYKTTTNEQGEIIDAQVIHITDRLNFNDIEYFNTYSVDFFKTTEDGVETTRFYIGPDKKFTNEILEYCFGTTTAIKSVGGQIEEYTYENKRINLNKSKNIITITNKGVVESILPIYLHSMSAKSYKDGMNIINTLQASNLTDVAFVGGKYKVSVQLNYLIDKVVEGGSLYTQEESILVKDVTNSITNFDVVVYDGALSIESTIDSAVNVPGDVVDIVLTMITDNETDELAVEKIKDVVIELTQINETEAIDGGKYRKEYKLSVSLADVFEIRHFTTNKELNVKVYSTLLNEKFLNIPVVFVPQQIQRLNVYKHAVNSVVDNKYEAYGVNDLVVTTGEASILQLNLYPYYSHVDEIEIVSSTYQDTSILLEQMIYVGGQSYKRLTPPSQTTDDRLGLILQQYTKFDNDGITKLYDGNLYVKMLLANNVPKNTEFTITINAYNYNILGERQLTTTNSVVLLAEDIPEITVSTATGSPYIVKGVNNDIMVNFKPTSDDQVYSYSIEMSTMISDTQYQPYVPALGSAFDSVSYTKGATTIENGRKLSTDILNVGIGVATGTRVTVFYTIKYLLNNNERMINTSTTFIVVDYDIDEISIHSFGAESLHLNMDVHESYKFGVDSVLFKVAPADFEDASELYGYHETDEEEYYRYFYGYGTIGNTSQSVKYSSKTGKFTFNNEEVVAISQLVGGKFNTVFKKVSKNEAGVTVYTDIENFTPGIYLKMISAKRLLQSRVDFFKRQVNANTYESFIDYSDINVGVYLSQSINEVDYEVSGLRYTYSIIGITPLINQTMLMSIDYAYNNQGELIFEELPEKHANYSKSFTFNVNSRNSVDVPIPIYSQQELENMQAGENYILMNDIVLVNWTPISRDIKSLDGNGYQLIIKNFDVSTGNIGLFNTVQENTLLKNLTINISQLQQVLDMQNFSEVYIGLLAVTNEGTITNCTVTADNVDNSAAVSNGEKIITVRTSSLLDGTVVRVMAGLFVYSNNNAITNSRVGGDASSTNIINFTASGNLAGFVCENNGHISASYAKNIKITNNLDVATDSQTAGFVAENGGTIVGSYVKGSDAFKQNSFFADKGSLYSNGSIGGFVFNNNGKIQDSYSNIAISSNARTAGFVFNNLERGSITNAYSASNIATNSALHMPFIGVNDKSQIQCVNKHNISNVYYYVENSKDFDASAVEELAVSVTKSNFGNQSKFAGFAFSKQDEYNAVWTMTNGYPELYSANLETVSEREIHIDTTNNQISYTYKGDYNLGTVSNPYIISNAAEYNYYFGLNIKNTKLIESKYFRLINNVDFESEEATIDAITKQLSLYNTEIDGNGFTINNVVVTADALVEEESVGLFKKIYSSKLDSEQSAYKSTIKNLNIVIKEGNAVGVSYVGGLAGIIEDSNIFNIDVSAIESEEPMIVKGKNVVGGLAGVVRGDSILLNINSSVSVEASYKESSGYELPNYYIAETKDASNVSHAGTVAGIVDIIQFNKNAGDNSQRAENASRTANRDRVFLVQNANVQNISAKGNITVNAEFAGGLFGYVGSNTHIYNSNFEVNTSDIQSLSSDYAIGGLVGIHFGKLSQVRLEHSIEEQDLINASIQGYVLNGDELNRGKSDLFRGDPVYAGGIIGVNMGGHLEYAYSRIDMYAEASKVNDLNREQYMGGLIGITYGGKVMQVYASGTVVTKDNDRSYAGGIIGRVDDFNVQINSTDETLDLSVDQTKLAINDVYAINFWDSASIVARNDGRYTGKYIGYSNSELIRGGLDTESLGLHRIAYIYEGSANIFSSLESSYYTLKLVGDGRYANQNTDEFILSANNKQYLEMLSIMFDQTSNSIGITDSFFNGLMSEYWVKFPQVIFPTFKAGLKTNEVQIFTASQLIKEVNKAPYKKYIIMNDLNFAGQAKEDSFISALFTGDIESGITDPNNSEIILPVNFYNITLTASKEA